MIDRNVMLLAHNAKPTSIKAAEKALPKSGTLRRLVFETVKSNGGLTDYELERILNGKHQSVSASRRSLVLDGYLVDSGATRKNEVSNDCIVWVTPDYEQGALF